MEDQRIVDEMLTRIASKAGGIVPLMDAFFSFLERKTDIYVQFDPADKKNTKYKVGFPIGAAEKMVLQSFRKYEMKNYNDLVGASASADATQSATTASSSGSPTKAKTTNVSAPTPTAPATPPRTPAATAMPPATPATTRPTSTFTPSYTPEGKQLPIGNGGIEKNYSWTQTLKDLTVYIDIAAGCRSKEVKCEIKAQSLLVQVRGETIIDGALEDVVKVGESMWTLSSTTDSALQQIVVTLDKTRQTWWRRVVAGHEEIDTTKVDSTQNISEYDETTQAAIRKIMFERRQQMRKRSLS